MRFRRSVNIAPGIKVNFTKTGVGMTFGGRGAHYSINSSGRRTRTIGLPGTGLYYQSVSGGSHHQATHRQAVSSPSPQWPTSQAVPGAVVPVDPTRLIPKPGLFAPASEKAYYQGVMAYLRQDHAAALAGFEEAASGDPASTSAHLFAGLSACMLDQDERAAHHLEAVVAAAWPLPDRLQARYMPAGFVNLAMTVKITDSITAQVPVSELAAALVLAELYQHNQRLEFAIGLIQQVHQALPNYPLVRLSLCDLLAEDHDYEAVVEISTGITNLSDVEVETLHIRAAALMALGMGTAALDAFNEALAKTTGRDAGLLNVVRFDRSLAYQQAGQRAKARADLERVYAADPTFPQIKERLAAFA
jgi:tetratricopeptide (TPR) repeat protein